VPHAHCCPGALGLESLEREEKLACAHCCLGALGLECLEQEKVALYPCSPGALCLHDFKQEESLMDVHLEQASICLK
jgi:hypothetical protein